MKHTVRPWKVVKAGSFLCIESTSGTIAQVESINREDDAKLIALAPEMLVQIKRELAWLKHIRPDVQARETIMIGFDQAIRAFENILKQLEDSNG